MHVSVRRSRKEQPNAPLSQTDRPQQGTLALHATPRPTHRRSSGFAAARSASARVTRSLGAYIFGWRDLAPMASSPYTPRTAHGSPLTARHLSGPSEACIIRSCTRRYASFIQQDCALYISPDGFADQCLDSVTRTPTTHSKSACVDIALSSTRVRRRGFSCALEDRLAVTCSPISSIVPRTERGDAPLTHAKLAQHPPVHGPDLVQRRSRGLAATIVAKSAIAKRTSVGQYITARRGWVYGKSTWCSYRLMGLR
jgi:hypothetical protein